MGEVQAARAIAEAFIAHTPRTATEVVRRLRRAGFDDDVVTQTLDDLERSGLVDDRAFANAWVESRCRSKGYGRIRLESELRRKGVDSDIIGEALRQVETDREAETARAVAIRLLGAADIADYSVRRRLAGYLQRRGYSWETIEQVIADIASNS